MKKIYAKIEGIHCNNCVAKIMKELLKDKKIKDVQIKKNIAYISYFGIKEKLEVRDNVIEFTPTKVGVFTYTCWMNMIKNNIKVVDDKNYFKEVDDE